MGYYSRFERLEAIVGAEARDVWLDPRPGDRVHAGPGFGALIVTSVTKKSVMAINLTRALLGGSKARRRIPREEWSQLPKNGGVVEHVV